MQWSEDPDAGQQEQRTAAQGHVIAAWLILGACVFQTVLTVQFGGLLGMMGVGMGFDDGGVLLLFLVAICFVGVIAVVRHAWRGLQSGDAARIRSACGWGLAVVTAEALVVALFGNRILALVPVAVAVVAVVLSRQRTLGPAAPVSRR